MITLVFFLEHFVCFINANHPLVVRKKKRAHIWIRQFGLFGACFHVSNLSPDAAFLQCNEEMKMFVITQVLKAEIYLICRLVGHSSSLYGPTLSQQLTWHCLFSSCNKLVLQITLSLNRLQTICSKSSERACNLGTIDKGRCVKEQIFFDLLYVRWNNFTS